MISKEFPVGVEAVARMVDTVVSGVNHKYPNLTVANFYKEVARLVPERTSTNVQISLVKALHGKDRGLVARARYSLVLISLSTIFSAAQDYFIDDESADEEVIQAAVFGALQGFPKLFPNFNIKQNIYTDARNSVIACVAARETVPREWVKLGWNKKVLDVTGESVIPWGTTLTEGDIRDLSEGLGQRLRIPTDFIDKYLRLKSYGGFRQAENDAEDLVEGASEDEARELISQALKRLKKWEARVLELRYGFETGYELGVEETAKILGISRERVRQIEALSLDKLGHCSSPLYRLRPEDYEDY